MPFYLPKTKFREAKPPKFRNKYWESWGPGARIIGAIQVLFGISLSVIEIVRILYGPTYKGIKNYDDNHGVSKFGSGDDSLLFPLFNKSGLQYQRVEKFHYWPWTYAANLFGLVVFGSGVNGIISSYRRSYSTVFSFLTTSLLATLFSGYLIGYYSILIKYYQTFNLNNASNRPQSMDTSWGLIGSNLGLSCASCIFGIIGFTLSFMGIRACTHKGFNDYNNIIVTSMGHHHHQRKYHHRKRPKRVPTMAPPLGTNLSYRPIRNISPPPSLARPAPPSFARPVPPSYLQNHSVNTPLKSVRT